MGVTFGGLKPPIYEHSFHIKNVGNPTHLPRGNLLRPRELDPNYFRSVHLGMSKKC